LKILWRQPSDYAPADAFKLTNLMRKISRNSNIPMRFLLKLNIHRHAAILLHKTTLYRDISSLPPDIEKAGKKLLALFHSLGANRND